MAKSGKTAVKRAGKKPKSTSAKAKKTPKIDTKLGRTRKIPRAAKKADILHVASLQNPLILEYRIFCEDSVRNLENQVNDSIKKGWAPVGGLVLQSGGNFLQTMIRLK